MFLGLGFLLLLLDLFVPLGFSVLVFLGALSAYLGLGGSRHCALGFFCFLCCTPVCGFFGLLGVAGFAFGF
jgi:hypothetical protein